MGYHRATLTSQRGFTLLELLVTLVVVVIAVGLAVPTIGRSTETIRIRADVAGFSAMMRHARERAIVTREPQAVVVDTAGRRVSRLAGGPEGEVRETRTLSERLTIEANPPPALVVRFEPQGGGSGGEFRLASGGIAYRVRVDALTGRVRSERE
jgi:prepilin-type N-terminal cleavage/methylation domain-containing protein